MGRIYNSVEELIGHTPLVELSAIEKKYNTCGKILAKLEGFNPAGSAKDRVALQMIHDARDKGLIKEGSTIIEPTSGNTGIGLCMVAAIEGYHCIIVMPDTMSVERQLLMKAYGAELVLTDGSQGMSAAIEKANELAASIPGSFIPGQFDNPANPLAHELTTGPEIYEDTDGKADVFVAAVGTGGTLTGTARFLKQKNPDIKVVAVEPADSPLLSKGYAGSHKIQGIGANFIPKILDTKIIDEVVAVTTMDAYRCGLDCGREEGILVGISAGAALSAAIDQACKCENEGKNIVVILPDSGERYLSSEMYNQM
ncbi:MAG: cysteine synthase A [Lachnospiraceae bacterium]|nr:cysteine synthase A [Candidatus Colinaster equi]